MSLQDHERISQLFLEALEHPADQRATFLERRCPDDTEVRHKVELLLKEHADVPTFLRTPAFDSDAVDPPAPRPERIGPFRILDTLGSGGMGIVYLAEQSHPIRRQVAVKVVRVARSCPGLLARFELEQLALARMSHENIARVLEAGTTEEGLPYFAMELVDGVPITEFCDQRRLSIEARLELFRQVLDGLQHAHQNAIIHRDVKPSNVLVTVRDGRPVPKVIDFGVAKAAGRAPQDAQTTAAGQFLGTPAYMSPEQAALDGTSVDTRTDVYSLGALLYELLVGSPPFDELVASGSVGFERFIRETEPQRPSVRLRDLPSSRAEEIADARSSDPRRLRRRLASDLDWIVLRALEKDRTERYGSPAELSQDLERHLNREPVAARAPSRSYRAWKFAARNKLGVAFAASSLALLLSFAVAQTVQIRRVAAERDRADRQAETAQQVSEFLVTLFERSPLEVRTRIFTPDQILENGLRKIDDLAERPVLHARLALAVGQLHKNLGLAGDARPLLEEAHERLNRLLGPHHPEVARAKRALGLLHGESGSQRRAEELLLDALEGRTRALGAGHVETLRSTRDLGMFYKNERRFEEAERRFEHAFVQTLELLGADHPDTLVNASLLGGIYIDQERYDDAWELLEPAREDAERVLGERHMETVAILYNLGCIESNRGHPDVAFSWLRRAVDHGFVYGRSLYQDRHLEELFDDPRFEGLAFRASLNWSGIWDSVKHRAARYEAQGSPERGLRLRESVFEAQRRALGIDHPRLQYERLELAELYLRNGDVQEAERLLAELAPEPGPPTAHSSAGDRLWLIAWCRDERGDRAGAIALVEHAARIYSRTSGGESSSAQYATAALSALHGKRTLALEQLRQLVDRGFYGVEWFRGDFAFRSLRGDPEFEEIVAKAERRRDPAFIAMR